MNEPVIVEDKGEPVMVRYHFYPDAQTAAESLDDPASEVAHPCTVGKAHTPDVADWIEEEWGSQYEDPDMVHLGPHVQEACAEFQRLLEQRAPECWTPRTGERVVLPSDNNEVAAPMS